ncbi:MAG TPA: hypothetical protein VEA38_13565 [Terriglobales bacterium]|nr:hypothetical protein [Terriglobales bacterium]
MHGHTPYPAFALGPDCFSIAGSFQCNAGSNPASTTFRKSLGLNFSVTYAATGVFTVTLASGLVLPAQPMGIIVSPQFAVLADDWFDTAVVGESTLTTTRTIVIQAHRAGVAREVANVAGNRINFCIFAQNNTGK